MTVHPKTSGATVGAALGVIIVAVLNSIHGVHLSPEMNAAIPSFFGTLLSWLVPGDTTTPPIKSGVPIPTDEQ